MRKLILVMGDLATGKSTFAGILSKRYKTAVFYKDSIKEVLGDTIGFANREENLKLSRATMELMLHIFYQQAELGESLILESNFREHELTRICKDAADRGYEVLTLVLRGNIPVLHERYLARIRSGNRHPVHLSTTFDIYEDFKEYVENARKAIILGNVIYIDANDFAYQTEEKVLSQIDDFMK